MSEIIFIIDESPDGGYVAQALGESIVTEADTLDKLKENIRDAIRCHFDDEQSTPKIIRLHFVRDEVISL